MRETCIISVEMLERAAIDQGVQEALDEAVHEAKGAEAARINNDGSDAQIAYLIEAVGIQTVYALLNE